MFGGYHLKLFSLRETPLNVTQVLPNRGSGSLSSLRLLLRPYGPIPCASVLEMILKSIFDSLQRFKHRPLKRGVF
jgi:hypothetical protein